MIYYHKHIIGFTLNKIICAISTGLSISSINDANQFEPIKNIIKKEKIILDFDSVISDQKIIITESGHI